MIQRQQDKFRNLMARIDSLERIQWGSTTTGGSIRASEKRYVLADHDRSFFVVQCYDRRCCEDVGITITRQCAD